jgi:hypothetical protein
MIKDIFKLKKQSWHIYLMEFLWGLTHQNFPNMCPYFWLSVANVIIAPVAIPLWALIKFIRISRRTYAERKRIRLEEEREAKVLRYKELLAQGIRFKELIQAAEWELIPYGKQSKKQMRITGKAKTELLNSLNFNELQIYYTRIDEIKAERKIKADKAYFDATPQREKAAEYVRIKFERNAKQRAKKEAKKKLKRNKRWDRKLRWNVRWENWNKFWSPIKMSHARKQQLIGKWTIRIKFVFKVFKYILYAIGVGVVVLLIWWLTTLNYSSWTWISIMPILKVIGIIVLTNAILVGVIYLCIRIAEYLKYHPIKLPWLKKILYILYVLYPFVWLWQGLCWFGRGLKRLGNLILALKSNNCPAIEWE